MQVSQQHQKPLAGPIRFELWPQIKKIQQSPVEAATSATATAATIIRVEVSLMLNRLEEHDI